MKTLTFESEGFTYRWSGGAFIAAWQTARKDEHVPDEMISLPESLNRSKATEQDIKRVVAEYRITKVPAYKRACHKSGDPRAHGTHKCQHGFITQKCDCPDAHKAVWASACNPELPMCHNFRRFIVVMDATPRSGQDQSDADFFAEHGDFTAPFEDDTVEVQDIYEIDAEGNRVSHDGIAKQE